MAARLTPWPAATSPTASTMAWFDASSAGE
jgi:hypothetical protein